MASDSSVTPQVLISTAAAALKVVLLRTSLWSFRSTSALRSASPQLQLLVDSTRQRWRGVWVQRARAAGADVPGAEEKVAVLARAEQFVIHAIRRSEPSRLVRFLEVASERQRRHRASRAAAKPLARGSLTVPPIAAMPGIDDVPEAPTLFSPVFVICADAGEAGQFFPGFLVAVDDEDDTGTVELAEEHGFWKARAGETQRIRDVPLEYIRTRPGAVPLRADANATLHEDTRVHVRIISSGEKKKKKKKKLSARLASDDRGWEGGVIRRVEDGAGGERRYTVSCDNGGSRDALPRDHLRTASDWRRLGRCPRCTLRMCKCEIKSRDRDLQYTGRYDAVAEYRRQSRRRGANHSTIAFAAWVKRRRARWAGAAAEVAACERCVTSAAEHEHTMLRSSGVRAGDAARHEPMDGIMLQLLLVFGAPATHASLAVACAHGRARSLELLLAHGGNPAGQGPNSRSLLHVLAFHGFAAMLQTVVDALAPDRVATLLRTRAGRDKTTPLHSASANGHAAALEIILRAGRRSHRVGISGAEESLRELLEIRDRTGQSAFHLAAKEGHTTCLKLLVASTEGPPDVVVSATDAAGRSALHIAADALVSPACLKLLVSLGVPVDVTDLRGRLATHAALTAKGDARSRSSSRAAVAVRCNLTRVLLDLGCDVDAVDGEGLSLLHHCLLSGHPDDTGRRDWTQFASDLVGVHGAAVDPRDARGTTPLMIAVLRGQADAARVLLEHGADATLMDNAGMSSRSHAREVLGIRGGGSPLPATAVTWCQLLGIDAEAQRSGDAAGTEQEAVDAAGEQKRDEDDERDNFTRLLEFYDAHAPQMVPNVPKLMRRCRGDERKIATLFAKIAAKYGAPLRPQCLSPVPEFSAAQRVRQTMSGIGGGSG